MSLLCYTYDADHHCIECTLNYARAVGVQDYLTHEHDLDEISENGIINLKDAIDLEMIPDSEGNPIHVMLDTEEWYANEMYEDEPLAILTCGTCHKVIEKVKLNG